jgi:hypothetical protein
VIHTEFCTYKSLTLTKGTARGNFRSGVVRDPRTRIGDILGRFFSLFFPFCP